jgi:1,4-alpha-glucan branching enzyme
MLFMGEEWNAAQPFLFFCDFHGELAEAVRRGRREEFKRFPQFADPAQRERIPDPQDPATFQRSKLAWADRSRPGHAEWLRWYQRVLATRRAHVTPLIGEIRGAGASHVVGPNAVFVSWSAGAGRRLRLSANLSDETQEFPLDRGREIWHEGGAAARAALPAWTVRWTLLE